MFKRVIYEEWAFIIVVISFALVACVFLIGTIRAFCLPKTKREHLANLPLEEDRPIQAPTDNPTSPSPKP